MRLKRWLLGALVAAALLYLALRPPSLPTLGDPLLRRDFVALHTLVSLSVYLQPGQSRAHAEQTLDQVQRFLEDFERRWSPWGNGTLGRINRALAAGQSITVPPDMQDLFALAEDQRIRSRGLFDARLGQLVRLWHFAEEPPPDARPPEAAQLREFVQALAGVPGWQRDASFGPAPTVTWDFGAIAKGYAVDQAIRRLQEAGIRNAIVNAGGNLRAIGRRGERPWRIGIRHPRAGPREAMAALETLSDEAVVTSGDYERYFEYEGKRYHHILNPRTGRPAEGLQAVTVVMEDAARADAASTALFVAGPERWRDASILLNVSQLLIVDHQGRVIVTRPLARRLEFPDHIRYQVVE